MKWLQGSKERWPSTSDTPHGGVLWSLPHFFIISIVSLVWWIATLLQGLDRPMSCSHCHSTKLFLPFMWSKWCPLCWPLMCQDSSELLLLLKVGLWGLIDFSSRLSRVCAMLIHVFWQTLPSIRPLLAQEIEVNQETERRKIRWLVCLLDGWVVVGVNVKDSTSVTAFTPCFVLWTWHHHFITKISCYC